MIRLVWNFFVFLKGYSNPVQKVDQDVLWKKTNEQWNFFETITISLDYLIVLILERTGSQLLWNIHYKS